MRLNAICFASGFGDGAYATWWGLDAHGTVAEAVTDFGLLDPLIFPFASSKD